MTIKGAAAAAVLVSSLAGAAPTHAQEPASVVAHFLRLSPPQVQALGQLLQARQATIAPLLQEIAQREQRIQELVAGGGDPAEIGVLVVQVAHLRHLVEAAQAQFLAAFQGLLDDMQRRKWEQVRVAARLQPVVPAFQALQLL